MRHSELNVDGPLKKKLQASFGVDWLAQAHTSLGPSMHAFVTEEAIWETYVIVQMLRGLVRKLGTGEAAQLMDLTATAEHAKVIRNEDSHAAALSLHQVVGFLSQLNNIMSTLGVSPPVAFEDARREAKNLVDAPPHEQEVTISDAEEALELVLALALR